MEEEKKLDRAHEVLREENRKKIAKILREQNRTRRRKDLFLFAFGKSLIIADACEYAGIHRRTYQNWINDDPEFRAACEQVKTYETDFAEDHLKIQIMKGDFKAICFFLCSRHPKYMLHGKRELLVYLKRLWQTDKKAFSAYMERV